MNNDKDKKKNKKKKKKIKKKVKNFCRLKKLLYLCIGKRKQPNNKSITLKKTLS